MLVTVTLIVVVTGRHFESVIIRSNVNVPSLRQELGAKIKEFLPEIVTKGTIELDKDRDIVSPSGSE